MIFQPIGNKERYWGFNICYGDILCRPIHAWVTARVTQRELLWMTIETIRSLLSAIPPQHAHDKLEPLMSKQLHSFGVFILNSSKNNLFSKNILYSIWRTAECVFREEKQ